VNTGKHSQITLGKGMFNLYEESPQAIGEPSQEKMA